MKKIIRALKKEISNSNINPFSNIILEVLEKDNASNLKFLNHLNHYDSVGDFISKINTSNGHTAGNLIKNAMPFSPEFFKALNKVFKLNKENSFGSHSIVKSDSEIKEDALKISELIKNNLIVGTPNSNMELLHYIFSSFPSSLNTKNGEELFYSSFKKEKVFEKVDVTFSIGGSVISCEPDLNFIVFFLLHSNGLTVNCINNELYDDISEYFDLVKPL